MAKDVIKTQGTVISADGNARFTVRLDNDIEIKCTIAGKIRQQYIKILVGDTVEVEMTPYDLTKGRISYRKKSSNAMTPRKSYKNSPYNGKK